MYARPSNLDDALGLLAESGARVIAGGTDVYPGAGERPLQADYVDVSNISALRGVSVDGACVRIGAATTWSDIARADLPPAFDALKVAARDVGAVQIQNRGTIAGNLCNASPAADGAPPLLILDAEVELASRRGTRRLALDVFINGARSTLLAPDEVMTAIVTPLPVLDDAVGLLQTWGPALSRDFNRDGRRRARRRRGDCARRADRRRRLLRRRPADEGSGAPSDWRAGVPGPRTVDRGEGPCAAGAD